MALVPIDFDGDEPVKFPADFIAKLLLLQPLDIDFMFKTDVRTKSGGKTTYCVESCRCVNLLDETERGAEMDVASDDQPGDIVVSITHGEEETTSFDLDYEQFWEIISGVPLPHEIKSLTNFKFTDSGSSLSVVRRRAPDEKTPSTRVILKTSYLHHNKKKDEESVKPRDLISMPADQFFKTCGSNSTFRVLAKL